MTILSILQSAFHYATTIISVVVLVKLTVWFNNAHQFNEVCTRFNSIKKSVDLLKEDMANNRRLIEQQMDATMTQQQQFEASTSNVLAMTSQLDEAFDCLDLLDNRMLELVEKADKTRRQSRNDPIVEYADIRYQQNEETFDNFIAECLVPNEEGKIGTGQIETLFKCWFESNVGPRSAGPSTNELNAYMSRTFHWKRNAVKDDSLTSVGAWVGISPK
jgi:hypothetical protein